MTQQVDTVTRYTSSKGRKQKTVPNYTTIPMIGHQSKVTQNRFSLPIVPQDQYREIS